MFRRFLNTSRHLLFHDHDDLPPLGGLAFVGPANHNPHDLERRLWTGIADPEAHFEIQIIDDIQYWGKRSGDPGYEKLDGIGKEAFVVNGLFGSGFDAQAVTDKQIIAIGMKGGSAGRDAAVAALRTVVERISKAAGK